MILGSLLQVSDGAWYVRFTDLYYIDRVRDTVPDGIPATIVAFGPITVISGLAVFLFLVVVREGKSHICEFLMLMVLP